MTIIYKPLDFPSHQFRVLEIEPAEDISSPLVVTLRHYSIEDVAEQGFQYQALSYVWGDQYQNREEILVRYEIPVTLEYSLKALYNPGEPLPTANSGAELFQTTVGENLASALRHLRSRSNPLQIWVDAICINQEDDEEKSYQVKFMYSIFESASFVTAWLGSPGDHTDAAMDAMNDVGQRFEAFSFHSVPELTDWTDIGDCEEEKYCGITISCLGKLSTHFAKLWGLEDPRDSNDKPLGPFLERLVEVFHSVVDVSPSGIGYTIGFYDLYERPYWNRTWVIQEYFAARALSFQCGYKSTSANTFLAFERLLLSYKIYLHDGDPKERNQDHSYPLLYARHPNQVLDNLILHSTRYKRHSLDWVLQVAYAQGVRFTTDSRDCIYAILGLAEDALGITVDYTLPPSSIFLMTASALLLNGNLSPLEYWKAKDGHCEHLPSWAVDWSGTIKVPLYKELEGVDCSLGRGRRKLRFENRNREVELSKYLKMRIRGEKVTTVSFVTESLGSINEKRADGLTWRDWMECLHEKWHNMHGQMQNKDGGACLTSPGLADQVIDIAFDFSGIAEGDRGTREARQRLKMLLSSGTWELVFEEEASEVLWLLHEIYSRFLIIDEGKIGKTEKGWMMYTEAECQPGDVIAIFYGGKIPFVLRETGQGLYKIIGTAYVHGIMYGEFPKEDITVENFEII